MEQLDKLVLDGDSAAIQRTHHLGPTALLTLDAHARHKNADVRFLVVECLVALGTPEALRRLLPYCEDSSLEVQLEAVNALLESNPVADMSDDLFGIYNRQKNGFLRRQLALVLGRLGAAESKSRLTSHLHDTDASSDGLIAALARLGNATAHRRLGELLQTAQGDRVADVLQLFRYVNRSDCASLLLPLIEREDVVQHLNSHINSVNRRACDLAIDELLGVRPSTLSFTRRKDLKPYAPSELAEARALLRAEATSSS